MSSVTDPDDAKVDGHNFMADKNTAYDSMFAGVSNYNKDLNTWIALRLTKLTGDTTGGTTAAAAAAAAPDSASSPFTTNAITNICLNPYSPASDKCSGLNFSVVTADGPAVNALSDKIDSERNELDWYLQKISDPQNIKNTNDAGTAYSAALYTSILWTVLAICLIYYVFVEL